MAVCGPRLCVGPPHGPAWRRMRWRCCLPLCGVRTRAWDRLSESWPRGEPSMPLLRTKSEPPAPPIEAPVDILSLARLDHHPLIAPHIANRAALHRRLDDLDAERTRLEAVRRDLDVGEAY